MEDLPERTGSCDAMTGESSSIGSSSSSSGDILSSDYMNEQLPFTSSGLLTIGFFLGFLEVDFRRPLIVISGVADTPTSALGVATSSSCTASSSDATSSWDCERQCRFCNNLHCVHTMYFFRGFRFLLPEALISSEIAAEAGVAVPEIRGAPVTLVAVFLGFSLGTREIRRRFGVSSSYFHQ
jgi:hypothetical protein